MIYLLIRYAFPFALSYVFVFRGLDTCPLEKRMHVKRHKILIDFDRKWHFNLQGVKEQGEFITALTQEHKKDPNKVKMARSTRSLKA